MLIKVQFTGREIIDMVTVIMQFYVQNIKQYSFRIRSL